MFDWKAYEVCGRLGGVSMILNKNGMPYYVTGTKYSYSTLKSMTKDKLIECLDIAQHNYECVNESEYNIKQYAKKLDKALDLACKQLEDNDSILFDLYDRFDTYHPTHDRYEWKEHLLESVETNE